MFSAKNFIKPSSLEEAYELNQKRANRIIGGMCWLRYLIQIFRILLICLDWDLTK